ncbi:MAG TPA: aconitate hydratase AcnA, partial [Pseudomonadaceae bacterium]|nr:aconitate hydratase AcnA [Pseudomonadaceae bacterium]
LNLLPLAVTDFEEEGGSSKGDALTGAVEVEQGGKRFTLEHGAVVIAAITSCTNTSNPAVLMAAGLLARKARAAGLQTQPWVKTSLAPGSKVVTDYLEKSGLLADLEALGFYLVGYGCTTCIGNSGPLSDAINLAISRGNLLACSVLSGNRNFEGRIHQEVRANYLASPPLVVAYALAGNLHCDLLKEPLGHDAAGKPIYLRDIWPEDAEVQALIAEHLGADQFKSTYAEVYNGNPAWNALPVQEQARYDWPDSTYVRLPPFFAGITPAVPAVSDIQAAHCLVMVGDSVTTDHISPAGGIAIDSPAGEWLQAQGVGPEDFNSYGSRRGNHEVMMRGTFANVRLKNQLAPGTEGCWTTHIPSQTRMSIFAAAERYRAEGTPLVVLAGKEYGAGSSRDWAAKGPSLLGVRVVLAESYERIHRSNLVGMGILPLQYAAGVSAESLGLEGDEQFTIPAISKGQDKVQVEVHRKGGGEFVFTALVRIDTPNEFDYFQNGGILHYVLRKLA